MKKNTKSSKPNKHREKEAASTQNMPWQKPKKKKNRFLLTIICILLSVIFLFGAALMTVTLIKRAKYAVMYEGYGMDVKTASYFASYYKYMYMQDTGVRDTASAWESDRGDGVTHGEALAKGAEQFMKEVLVGNSLFDKYLATLNSSQKKTVRDTMDLKIRESVKDALKYMPDADGTEKTFNKNVEKYGFDYKSFKKAVELQYKYQMGCTALYGSDGAYISSLQLSDEEKKWLSEYYEAAYSRVMLIFIDYKHKYSSGNKTLLTDSEKDALLADVAQMREAITDGTMTPEAFSRYFDKHNIMTGISEEGEYYYSAAFADDVGIGSELTEAIYSMKAGEYAECKYSVTDSETGVTDRGDCFIYKYALDDGAYDDKDNEFFFRDFYRNAAIYMYGSAISLGVKEAKTSDRFKNVDIVSLPYNYLYIFRG